MDVRLPDGTLIRDVPDGMSKADFTTKLKANGYDVSALDAPANSPPGMLSTLGASLGKGVGDVALGAQHYLGKGIQALGADKAGQWLVNDAASGKANMATELAPYKAANPMTAAVGETTGNVLATLPIGGALAIPVKAAAKAIPALQPLGNAIASAGFTTGSKAAPGAAGLASNMLTRAAGGAVVGGASAGLVDPESAGLGAVVGAALPPALAGAGALGKKAAGALLGNVSPEVQALAKRAGELGIDIPADRIANSKPMNAIAAGLNYVPMSGRAAVETRMQDQLNTALSKTFGQDSPNVTQALRKAQGDLGGKFDSVLQNNTVKVDPQFLTDLADASNKASRELGTDGASIISKQVSDIADKAASGEIDGQAAYNIKKTLDRIGNRNSPEAFYARDLKKSLMGALDRSLGPQEAAAFKETRQQYGNMLSLENLAQNGVEGDISIARLANMKNINSPDLQELADISAQFLKQRESPHGAAQRAFAGLGVGAVGGPAALGGSIVAGRAASAALDSNALRQALLRAPSSPNPLQGLLNTGTPMLLKATPAVIAGRGR